LEAEGAGSVSLMSSSSSASSIHGIPTGMGWLAYTVSNLGAAVIDRAEAMHDVVIPVVVMYRYAKTQEDFTTLDEYNDYLEAVEDKSKSLATSYDGVCFWF